MVTITLSPEALARLDTIASERGQTRSAAVETLVRNARLRESETR
jgi:predicted transcriptional regulator